MSRLVVIFRTGFNGWDHPLFAFTPYERENLCEALHGSHDSHQLSLPLKPCPQSVSSAEIPDVSSPNFENLGKSVQPSLTAILNAAIARKTYQRRGGGTCGKQLTLRPRRCLEAGATEYLSKPVSLKTLVKTINEQLK
ncbi:MAG: hypothetical protein HYU84_07140 [Chloroflexi bacterium]|nr:hypothetical protein [Chloroflexota bacterium]MBI3167219.1 hypothetical protein [Chloroflexota bacterium]